MSGQAKEQRSEDGGGRWGLEAERRRSKRVRGVVGGASGE